jgi:hypothetical protein
MVPVTRVTKLRCVRHGAAAGLWIVLLSPVPWAWGWQRLPTDGIINSLGHAALCMARSASVIQHGSGGQDACTTTGTRDGQPRIPARALSLSRRRWLTALIAMCVAWFGGGVGCAISRRAQMVSSPGMGGYPHGYARLWGESGVVLADRLSLELGLVVVRRARMGITRHMTTRRCASLWDTQRPPCA